MELVKPEKLYLNNTNLSFAYCDSSDIGRIREQFFSNQLDVHNTINYSKIGDFLVDEKYIFEIGSGNKIPLWLFGFLY